MRAKGRVGARLRLRVRARARDRDGARDGAQMRATAGTQVRFRRVVQAQRLKHEIDRRGQHEEVRVLPEQPHGARRVLQAVLHLVGGRVGVRARVRARVRVRVAAVAGIGSEAQASFSMP